MSFQFSPRFVQQLPGDALADNTPRIVKGALWSKVAPTPVASPKLLLASDEVAQLLGLSLRDVDALLPVLSGNAPPPGSTPFAANYGGHQFGHWAGQLGDGRAIGLGELNGFELQLKGAGPTPYSRRADGRAVLRSSIREFLCSEAMHHLGVPTTRALSPRDDRRAGDARHVLRRTPEAFEEPGAIVCRVAPSFLRFGNFELPPSREDTALLRQLVDFTLHPYYFPGFGAVEATPTSRGADEVAAHGEADCALAGGGLRARRDEHRQHVHPRAHASTTAPTAGWTTSIPRVDTEHHRRADSAAIATARQPAIGLWNIERLGVALLPLLGDDDEATGGAGRCSPTRRPVRSSKPCAAVGGRRSVVSDDVMNSVELAYANSSRSWASGGDRT